MNTIFSKLPDLISDRLLLAYLVPILVVAVANIFLVDAVFGGDPWDVFYEDGKPKIIAGFVFLLAALVVSYVAAPFNALAREVLEGRHGPGFIIDPFRVRWQRKRNKAAEAVNGYEKTRILLDIQIANYDSDLRKARRIGVGGGKIPDHRGLSRLQKQFRRLNAKICKDVAGAKQELAAAKACLEFQLERFSADIAGSEKSERLSQFHDQMQRSEKLLKNRIDALIIEGRTEEDIQFSRHAIEPTRLGNFQAALRDYAFQRYNLDYEIFWPHLDILKAEDAAFQKRYADSDRRLEFLINMFFLAPLHLAWVGVIIARTDNILTDTDNLTLAVILFLAPLIGAFVYYRSIVQTYRTMMIARRSAVDLFRFDVLDGLKLPPPQALHGERETWGSAHRHIAYAERSLIRYDAAGS